MHMYGSSKWFPKNSALFGLVSYNDPYPQDGLMNVMDMILMIRREEFGRPL